MSDTSATDPLFLRQKGLDALLAADIPPRLDALEKGQSDVVRRVNRHDDTLSIALSIRAATAMEDAQRHHDEHRGNVSFRKRMELAVWASVGLLATLVGTQAYEIFIRLAAPTIGEIVRH